MKKCLLSFVSLMLLFVSCGEKFDDSAIWEEIQQLEARVTALEETVAANVSALQSMVSLGSIASWDYDSESGKGVITLVDGKEITVDQTVSGYSLITVTKGSDNVWYWAICKDGVSTPLEVNGKKVPVSVTPALKISDDNEWMISVDGGVTWVNTGIAYHAGSSVTPEVPDSPDDPDDPDSPDGSDQDEMTEIVFFKSAETDGDYLILTLADDSVIKVAIVGDSTFAAAAEALWFSRTKMQKSVALEMVNVGAYTITEKPDGWKAIIEEEYLTVTSPDDFAEYPHSGVVKVLALFENGQPAILSLEVAYEPMVSLKYVNDKVVVTLSEHTGEDFTGYVLKGWEKSQYTDEKALAWLTEEAADIVPCEGTAEYGLDDIVENYDPTAEYVVAVSPYLPSNQVAQGTMKYELSDIQSIRCKPSSQWQITNVRFDSAVLTAVIEDDEFFGGFFNYADWNNYGRDNLLESLSTNSLEPNTISSYHGPANAFPDGETIGKINPATEYVVWYLPVKESGQYSKDDFVLYTFTTPDVQADASIAAPAASVRDVTISGFTADLTPAAGAYKTYTAIVRSSAIPETDVETVRYLINVNDFSKGSDVKTVSTASYSSDDDVYLLAVSISEDGGYGALLKRKVELEALTFTDDLGVAVTGIEYGIGNVTLNLSFTGNPVSITYMAATYTFYTDEDLQKMLALEQLYGVETKQVSSLGGTLQLNDLTLGAEHTFYAVVKGEGYKASKLYKYVFTPTSGIDYIQPSSDVYDYGKPVLSGSYTNGTTYTLTLDVEMPSTCVQYWLFKGNDEYFTGDLWGDSDKLVTRQFMDVTEHDSSETGLIYEFMNSTSRIYMVWLDDQGRYHAICEYNPKG